MSCFSMRLLVFILVEWFLIWFDWHENLEKIIFLKLVNVKKVICHLNISSTMKNNWKLVSRFFQVKLCFKCYSLFYLVWWPCFTISKQHFHWFLLNYMEYSHQISAQKSENMAKLMVPKSEWVWKKLGMTLWIKSGTFNVAQWLLRVWHWLADNMSNCLFIINYLQI